MTHKTLQALVELLAVVDDLYIGNSVSGARRIAAIGEARAAIVTEQGAFWDDEARAEADVYIESRSVESMCAIGEVGTRAISICLGMTNDQVRAAVLCMLGGMDDPIAWLRSERPSLFKEQK